jgi:hypothetical protein
MAASQVALAQQQYARPISTNAANGWTAVPGGTHHEALDETTANGGTDYIDSGTGNVSTASFGIGLLQGTLQDPGGNNLNDHILRAQCQATGGGKGPESCIVALYDNGTGGLIATLTAEAARTGFPTPPGELVIPDASGIQNYDNLRVEIAASIDTGNKDAESVQVSWVELEVPAPSNTAPSVTTNPITGEPTNNQATVGGNVTSDGNDPLTEVGVYYSTSPGFNPPVEGTRILDPDPDPPVVGNFTLDLTGLLAGTTYYYRAFAKNGIGETIADLPEEQFTTKDFPVMLATPTVTIDSPTSATLGGEMTSNGFDPTGMLDCGIEWGTSSGGPYTQESAGVCTENNAFTAPQLIGLTTGQDYFFRSYATNSVGTGYSNERSFKPVDTPTVDAVVGTLTDTTAVLGGDITDTGGDTITAVGIIWDLDTNPIDGGLDVPMTNEDPFSGLVGSLTPGTDYWFVAYAENSGGRGYSSVTPFTTLAGPPTMDPVPTSAIVAADEASLGGTMTSDGNGTISDCGVEYHRDGDPAFQNNQSAGVCTENNPFATNVSGLTPGATYHFRAYATNGQGTAYSGEDTFVPAAAPSVTSSVANIGLDSAELGGNVTSDGGSPVFERGVYWNTASPATDGTKVSMGSGTGLFSQLVTGLPLGTTIFYEAYATNSVDIGYSGELTFDTLSEPTVQASNISFPQVASKSMRISWTRGNGTGVIVVMRLGSRQSTFPQDGDDYLANADFTVAPPLTGSTDHKVVYQGSGTSILVTGLLENTLYSVVLYEYGGTGVDTEYLLADDPQGTNSSDQSTNDVPVHNMDYGVDCDNCHKHGGFGTNGDAGLIVSCQNCHKLGGDAQDKLEFSNHLTPNRNPDIDYVDCGVCHELHNPGGENTTWSTNWVTGQSQYNKSYLRTNVSKYIPGAKSGAYLHTDQPLREGDHPNAPQEAITPDRAVEGGTDVPISPATPTADNATGYCQVCHTMTLNHTNNPLTSGSSQIHDGYGNNSGLGTESNCGECHEHNDTFKGKGGTSTCMVCHGTTQSQGSLDRREIMTEFDSGVTVSSTHIYAANNLIEEADCLVCHDFDTHQQQYVTVNDLDNVGLSYPQPTAEVSAQSTAEGGVLSDHCFSCHDDGVPSAMVDNGNQTQASPFTGSASAPILNGGDTSLWISAGHNRPTGPPVVGCLGGCHSSAHGTTKSKLLNPSPPTWTVGAALPNYFTNFCMNCHDGSPSTKNVAAEFDTGTDYSVTGMNGASNNQRHDVIGGTQEPDYAPAVACMSCHSPHVDNAANPVRNPETGNELPTYSGTDTTNGSGSWNGISYDLGGNLDPANPEGGGSESELDYIQFCLVCHDGTAPAGVDLGSSPDISASYLTSRGGKQHGNGEGGSGSSTGKGILKPPWTTQADFNADLDPTNPYAALNCTTCHGAHGSGNIYNLRTSITVAGTQMKVGGVKLGSEFDNQDNPFPQHGSTTYIMPVDGTNQTSDRFSAWCTFCHEMNAHAGVGDTTACNSGHRHGGNNF